MRRAAVVLAVLITTGCVEPPPPGEFTPVPSAAPEAIDQVVFLVGDAGTATFDRSPLLVRLRDEVERWSATLAREEAVSVLFLGDNVYPAGVHDVGDPQRGTDSLYLHGQVETVSGPHARRWGNRGLFLAGNHDWGQLAGPDGLARLRNEEAMLDAYGKSGIRVDLYPEAGRPGPVVVDAGTGVRFVFLDTHWWLQAAHDHILRDTVFFSVDEVLRGAGDRSLVFASHHPYASAGAHGGPVPFWRGLGILWLLNKTGSLVQDLNSPIYRELQNGLGQLFRDIRRPLIYVGGHDHSLQVIEGIAPDKPQWSLVSGSGSKLSDVGRQRGMRFGADQAGFMRLDFRRDRAVDLHVFAANDADQHCGDDAGEDVPSCMREAPGRYEEVFSIQLREPPTRSAEGGRGPSSGLRP